MTIKKDEENNKDVKGKNDIFFKSINILKIDTMLSFFINKFTLRIFYYLLFKFAQYLSLNKKELINYERSIYFVNINAYLPSYFRKGMIEIQFSVPSKNRIKLIEQLKSLQFKYNVFPFFFILKKMEISRGKYIFNFPKYKHCISLGFSKHTNIKNKDFFVSLYKVIYKNQGNIYVTKDETFLYNKPEKKLIRYCKSVLKVNKIISSDFKEKLLNS